MTTRKPIDDTPHQPTAVSPPTPCAWFEHRPWLLALVLVIVTFVAYQPAWRAGFVWDDDSYVTNNLALRSLGGLERIWFEPGATVQYYPLVFTTFWAEYHLWTLQPLGYHLVTILLHALNAVLLWRVLRRLEIPGSWWAAAVFALHPVNVESVAWVTELKNTQSGVFVFLSMLCFLRFRPLNGPDAARVGDWRYYPLVLVLFLCALLSKTVTCSLPAVLMLLIWWKTGRLGKRDALELTPLFALGAALGFMTTWVEAHVAGAVGAEWSLTLIQRCLNAGRALWFYAGKLLWPRHLTFVYPRWEIDAGAPWQYAFPLAALAVLIALWLLRSRIGRGPLVAVLCFAGTLLPVLGFVNGYFFRYSYVADHFQYLAGIGLISLAVSAGAAICERGGPRRRNWGTLAAAVVLTTLAALTHRQSQTYATSEKLYRSTIARNPRCWMAYNNLGATLLEQGRLDEAIDNLQHGLQFRPNDAGVRNNLGTAFFRQRRLVEAVSQYRESTRLQPDYPEAHYNLGNALSELNHLNEAAAEYQDAIRYDPDYADAHYNLANTLARLDRPTEALLHYQMVTRLRPNDVDAWFALANILGQQGNLAGALAGYQRTLQLKPDLVDARYNLANTLVRAGHTNDAIAQYQIAVQLKPDLVPAQFNLAAVLLASGNAGESVDHFQQVIALKPDLASAYYKLAVAWVRLGRFESATNGCDRALRLNPEYPEALADCAWLLATHDPISAGDAARALKLAAEACRLTGNRDPSALATLSAVYASAGQFTNAVATVEAALALLGNSGTSPLREQFKNQLAQYRAGLPYRITLPAALPSDW